MLCSSQPLKCVLAQPRTRCASKITVSTSVLTTSLSTRQNPLSRAVCLSKSIAMLSTQTVPLARRSRTTSQSCLARRACRVTLFTSKPAVVPASRVAPSWRQVSHSNSKVMRMTMSVRVCLVDVSLSIRPSRHRSCRRRTSSWVTHACMALHAVIATSLVLRPNVSLCVILARMLSSKASAITVVSI